LESDPGHLLHQIPGPAVWKLTWMSNVFQANKTDMQQPYNSEVFPHDSEPLLTSALNVRS
jgi:hypothetical protein